MVKKSIFSWGILGFSKKELFVGTIIFISSGFFFRWIGGLIWRKPKTMLRDRAMVLSPEINELTIQEFETDMDSLERRIDNLNNDFLLHNKGLMENTEKFRDINKIYLELRLRLNHINSELEENNKYKTNKIKRYEETMTKMKTSLDLLSEELKRETDESQSYTLNMLTLIETIFLPLGVLTGYFGMNFSSMGGHVGDDHKPAPGILGMKYGQTLVWVITLVFMFWFLSSSVYTKMEHFDIRETQKCNETKKILPFNVTSQDLRKLPNVEKSLEFPSIFELPYNDLNFYVYK